jgi:hypothetical protein
MFSLLHATIRLNYFFVLFFLLFGLLRVGYRLLASHHCSQTVIHIKYFIKLYFT